MLITPENLDEVVRSLVPTPSDHPFTHAEILNNVNRNLSRFSTELYLGNPGDSGYTSRPVHAVLVCCSKSRTGGTILWFLHSNPTEDNPAALGISQVPWTDFGKGLRTTSTRTICATSEIDDNHGVESTGQIQVSHGRFNELLNVLIRPVSV